VDIPIPGLGDDDWVACGDMLEEELNLQPKDLEDNKTE
jgi:hypothetical protein